MKDDIRPQPVKLAAETPLESTPSVTDKEKPEPAFKPPDEVAREDLSEVEDANPPEKLPERPKSRFKLPKKLTNKQIIFISAGLGLLLAALGIWWFTYHKKPMPPPKPVAQQAPKPAPPKPTTVPARLTGIQVSPELDKLPVTGVMVENSPDARPQFGLKDAGVVYEAIAEGGITRFLALFQTEQPDRIEPVRSVRPYYLDFLAPFDAGIAHAGGSGEALSEVRSGAFRDLDYFFNPNSYHRDPNRYAPHNLYTSRAELLAIQNRNGWGASNFSGFTRKSEKPSSTPTARSIDLALSGYLYNPHYDYDAATNTYRRSEGGKPHTDAASGQQLAPKVVIALIMPHSYAGIYSVYQDLGSGKAYIFQDGVVIEANWQKPDRNTQIKFVDNKGAVAPLNAGQTWLTLISSTSELSYKP